MTPILRFMLAARIVLAIVILLTAKSVFGQEIQLSRSLISPFGTSHSNGNIYLSHSIGEPVSHTSSGSGITLTQGFQQPSVLSQSQITMEVRTYSSNCLNSEDGYAAVTMLSGTPPFSYQWIPSGGTEDSTSALLPGVYYIEVTDARGRVGLDTAIISSVYEDMCDFYFYSGVTPNGDGSNDVWIIDGITLHADNRVMIFSRWGDKVWERSGYNNGDISWDGTTSSGRELPGGTYFYICEITGMPAFRGWVQLMR